MRFKLLCLILVCFFVRSPALLSAGGVSAAQLVKDYRDGLVFVEGKTGQGSGFIVDYKGQKYLFTNAHVMAGVRVPKFKLLDRSPVRVGAAVAAVAPPRAAPPAAPLPPRAPPQAKPSPRRPTTMPTLFNTHPKKHGQGAFWHVWCVLSVGSGPAPRATDGSVPRASQASAGPHPTPHPPPPLAAASAATTTA